MRAALNPHCRPASAVMSQTSLDVMSLKVNELRAACKERGLSPKGKKAVLQERLKGASKDINVAPAAVAVIAGQDAFNSDKADFFSMVEFDKEWAAEMAEQKAERVLERKEANSMGAWAAPGCLPISVDDDGAVGERSGPSALTELPGTVDQAPTVKTSSSNAVSIGGDVLKDEDLEPKKPKAVGNEIDKNVAKKDWKPARKVTRNTAGSKNALGLGGTISIGGSGRSRRDPVAERNQEAVERAKAFAEGQAMQPSAFAEEAPPMQPSATPAPVKSETSSMMESFARAAAKAGAIGGRDVVQKQQRATERLLKKPHRPGFANSMTPTNTPRPTNTPKPAKKDNSVSPNFGWTKPYVQGGGKNEPRGFSAGSAWGDGDAVVVPTDDIEPYSDVTPPKEPEAKKKPAVKKDVKLHLTTNTPAPTPVAAMPRPTPQAQTSPGSTGGWWDVQKKGRYS